MQFLHQKQKIFFFILFVFLVISSIFSFQIIAYAQTPWVCPSAPSVHYSSEGVCNSNCAPSSCIEEGSPAHPWFCPFAPDVHYSSESDCNSNCETPTGAPSSCTGGSSPGVPIPLPPEEVWFCPFTPDVPYPNETACSADCKTSTGIPFSCTEGSPPGVPLPPPDTPSSGPSESGKLKLYNPLGTIDSFAALAAAIFKAIVIIAIPLTVIFLIWAGVLFVTARGNEEQLKRAKKVFVWSVIGAMVIVASWVIAVAINTSVQDL